MTRVVILCGVFGGIYAALRFERALARGEALEVTLVNRENFFLFTPMLHEVAASDLDLTHTMPPSQPSELAMSLPHPPCPIATAPTAKVPSSSKVGNGIPTTTRRGVPF